MTTQTKVLTVLAVAALFAVAGTIYVAQAAENTFVPGRARMAGKLASLGVTAEQKSQVKEILRKHQPTMQPLIKQIVSERRTLRDTIHAQPVDESAIRAQVDKVAKAGAALAVQRAQVAHEIHSVLTTEQLQKIEEMELNVDARLDGFLDRIAKRVTED